MFKAGKSYLIKPVCCLAVLFFIHLYLNHNLFGNVGLRRNISPPRTWGNNTLSASDNSNSSEETLAFTYSDFYKNYVSRDLIEMNTSSQPLEINKSMMDIFRFPWDFIDDLNRKSAEDFVFVTACSENHFNESKGAIASVQKFFPGRKILFYDWGLSPDQKSVVLGLCGVEYRVFNFSTFPAAATLIGRAYYQAHKIFVIADAMINNTGVFWIDASVRFMSSRLTSAYNKAVETGGVAYFSKASHSTFAVTHPNTYNFFPTNLTAQKTFKQVETNAALYYKTRKIFDCVLWWWFLCGLREDCISPTTDLICDFKSNDRMKEYAGCHRVDQSIANVLVSNLYRFNLGMYFATLIDEGVLKIDRRPKFIYKLKECLLSELHSDGADTTHEN